jgi:xanthine phosphoribosyltransferase
MATNMKALRDRIAAEGRNLGSGILKIDSLLNHQIYPQLMYEMGEEMARRFADVKVDRILTAEISGIAPALMTGYVLKVPVVYARKHKPITMFGWSFWKLRLTTPKAARSTCSSRRNSCCRIRTC